MDTDMATMAATSQALATLRETINPPRPPAAYNAQSTGVRLVNVLRSTGWLSSRKRLSLEEIVQLSAVVICLDVIAQDISKVPMRMYERLGPYSKRLVMPEEHPVAEFLATEPNRFMTWQEFFEMSLLHLGLARNAFIAKRQAEDGTVRELIPCMPARTTILAVQPEDDPVNQMGFYAYEVRRNTPHEKIMLAKLPEFFLQDEMIHLRMRMFDGLTGYSNIEVGAKIFGQADELQEYQTRLFKSDGQQPGVFQMGKESGDSLSDVAFKRLREQLAEASRQFREDQKPIVLEEGMTFETISMNAEQAQVKEARDAAVVDVARVFRVPPHKIFHLINVKYENMETLEKSYVNDTLIPYARVFELAFMRRLLSRKDRAKYFFEFDRREMLLNDPEKLSEVVKVMLQNGAMEHDEARVLFGWSELAGNSGKTRMFPSTYNVVESKTNKVLIAAGGAKGDGTKEDTGKKPPKKDADDAG